MTSSAVGFAYALVAMFVVALLVYVMQKVEDDRLGKADPLWLQWARRAAFVSTGLAILYSIDSSDWQLTCFLLVGSGGTMLAVNAVSLALRAPPNNKGKISPVPPTFSHLVGRMVSYFSAHRR